MMDLGSFRMLRAIRLTDVELRGAGSVGIEDSFDEVRQVSSPSVDIENHLVVLAAVVIIGLVMPRTT